jgi:MFS family permease
MSNPYHALFRMRGTKQLALTGLLARIPLPMTGIGIITMLSQLRGSYALAGLVSATFVVMYALLSPRVSALVDRYGQSRVLPLAAMISVLGLLFLLICTWFEMSDWTLFIGAALAGSMPSMSAMVRARWTTLYRGQPQLQTAYSLETVFDEVTFIVGPPLAVALSVTVLPQAGLLAAALLLFAGVGIFILQRETEPPVIKATQHHSHSVFGIANVRLLSLFMVAMGIIVGTIDIVSVAFAEQVGQPAAASLVLSAYAIGSCVAGLVFGAIRLSVPLHRLLLLGGLLTAISTLPLLYVNGVSTLAVTVCVSGLFFAPTMIVAMSLIERLVPEHQLTEGMTWLLAGLNIGVAMGAAVSGQLVDAHGAQAGFYTALSAGALVLGIACFTSWRLRTMLPPPAVNQAN